MRAFIYSLLVCLAVPVWTLAQFPTPTTPDAPCEPEPNNAGSDTAFGFPDEEGFVSIFNGKDFSGWWQSCLTTHSQSNPSQGGIFRVSPEQEAIYSEVRGNAGGIIMTRKKYTHYEIKFDIWPGYGNDAGVFHRTNARGQCYQTVLDYINSGSMGGTWGEGPGFGSRDLRPWSYSGENNISLNTGRGDSWTAITRALDPTSYGCPSSGCGQSDYNRLWDADGWNEMRIQFYGAHVNGNSWKMKSWFRSEGADTWVPILQDTTWNRAPVEDGYIGFQIHGGNRWGDDGTWYRNIKIRPLEADGTPIIRGCRDERYAEYNPNATADYPDACQIVPVVVRNNLKHVEFGQDLSVTIRKPGTYKLRLVDIQGKVLYEQKIESEGQYNINNQNLEEGVYFFQVLKGEENAVKKYTLK